MTNRPEHIPHSISLQQGDSPISTPLSSGADIAKEVRAHVADLNDLLFQAHAADLIVVLEENSSDDDHTKLSVTISQRI